MVIDDSRSQWRTVPTPRDRAVLRGPLRGIVDRSSRRRGLHLDRRRL